MQRTAYVAIGVGIVALVGCAVGSAADYAPTNSELATVPIEAGTGNAESITLEPPAPPEEDAGTKPPSDAGGGLDAGGGGGGGSTICNATNTCMAATDLGSVSGDTGSSSLSAQGSTSAWFAVRVTEDDSAIFASKLKMNATLTSPGGANFDLYVYVPPSDTRECSVVTNSSTSTANYDAAGVSFGESGTYGNGSDDSRTVTVEVRRVSGTCSSTATWTLNIYGNQ